MKKLIWFSILIFISISFLHAQKRYITIPENPWEFTEKRAAICYEAAREFSLIDTIIDIRILNSVFWFNVEKDNSFYVPRFPDDTVSTYIFSVDSIKDRGSNRRAYFTIATKTPDPTKWISIKERWSDNLDSTAVIRDTIAVSDSTFSYSRWFKSSGKGSGPMTVYLSQNTRRLSIWMEKVIGNPEVYNGMNQQARMHFQLSNIPPPAWYDRYGVFDEGMQ